jgi:hypothetical protein
MRRLGSLRATTRRRPLHTPAAVRSPHRALAESAAVEAPHPPTSRWCAHGPCWKPASQLATHCTQQPGTPALALPRLPSLTRVLVGARHRRETASSFLSLALGGGAVVCAGGLASTVFDRPPACQLAIQLAQQDDRLARVAGGAVAPQWWGFSWEGQVFHNRAAVTVPLSVAGAPPGLECVLRGKA